ncbi:hypothetical protein [Ilumatobacter sp.]|uniref:hypothetical protein n=1 Tax=Ilumatobacter sp. TaxID=1967498 RepID=UPI00374FECA1
MSIVKSASTVRAVDALRHVLPTSADVQCGAGGEEPDLVVNGCALELRWVGRGRLGDARQLLQDAPVSERLIAVAREFSPGAKNALTEQGVGWVDETGAAEIAVGSIVVSRTGRPTKQADPEARWTPSVLATAEALLCGLPATVSSIEEVTGLSTGSCTKALRTLTQLGLLASDAERGPTSGRHVTDPTALLEAYATADRARRPAIELVVGVLWRDAVARLAQIGQRWTAGDIGWASTGAVASAVLAPFLTTIDAAVVYVDTETIAGLEATARVADLVPIEGGRLTLRPFPTVSTRRLSTFVDGLQVAPWPRVYADLQDIGVRGEEAAEHLREVVGGDR